MTALLDGVRVLGIEDHGVGPYGSQPVADLGAQTIARQLSERNPI